MQRIIQEFNFDLSFHVSITLWCQLCSWGFCLGLGGRGDGCCKPPPPLILLYFTIWLYILIYTILLYILFFKTIIFFPKFNFLASYSSLFLKSNLTTFPYFGLKPKLGTQNQITTSILVCIISLYIYIYICIYMYVYIYITDRQTDTHTQTHK